MRKFLLLPLLAALLTAANPVMAGTSTSQNVNPDYCSAKDYPHAFDKKPAAKWRWLNLGGVNAKIPTFPKQLPIFDKSVDGLTKRYSFGNVYNESTQDCVAARAYDMDVTTGNTYKPGFKPYDAWVERIGSNTITFYQATGDRDAPGAMAIILKRGRVIRISNNTGEWSSEARAVLASIN